MISTRRDFLQTAVLGCGTLAAGSRLPILPAAEDPPPAAVDFGFSLYGMKSLHLVDAISFCKMIGYDSVEFACLADWPADPVRLDAAFRKRLKHQLQVASLDVSGLMDNLAANPSDEQHQSNLERIKRLGELAHDIQPGARTPVIETVLGGKPEQWLQVRDKFVERLRDWARVAQQQQVTLALKAHVGGALHTPMDAVWLVEQIKSQAVELTYDFSHFVLREMSLENSWKTMAARTRFIHIKDATGTVEKFQFTLPGTGGIDYAAYFALLKNSGYRGPVVVEVSGQIHSRPGYDPVAAAKTSYAQIAPFFEKAGLKRQRLK